MTIVANNKKARYEYFIEETIEAGMQLFGSEVKSLRNGNVSIRESFAEARDGELWLINANITMYKNTSKVSYVSPIRQRKLLVHKKEISKISGKVNKEGMTIVPLKLYFNSRGIAKLQIAIAKGKKLHDKREDKKRKDWNIQKQRILKEK